ncbi:MFS transporter [bacterium]|jgi:MFS family permease|nr:MFS transporter [bacterium]
MGGTAPGTPSKSPLREIIQPFIDMIHAPRALWGINLAYFLEGWVYFGMLGYLAMHFSDFIFAGSANPDIDSHHMVMFLTAGITISMFFLGSVADKKGIRKTLLMAFCCLLAGRIIWAAAPFVFTETGMWSNMHLMTMAGMLLVVIGYGMYQPAAYAGVRKFTTPKTAAMGFAMLYALMNLGGWLPTFFSPIRNAIGIAGSFWVYTAISAIALIVTFFILTRKVEEKAVEQVRLETANDEVKEEEKSEQKVIVVEDAKVPIHLLVTLLAVAAAALLLPAPFGYVVAGLLALMVILLPMRIGFLQVAYTWLANHPLSNTKFFFFIFALIPVQTLFTYNWLILPQYLERAFEGGFVSDNFEVFANMNPILIFIAVPIITAITMKRNVYSMMIIGTFVMAVPAFLLAIDTSIYTLLGYLLIMTIGEAMWQPRFLQYAAEIAPEGRTGAYMGVAQFPWFLTKMVVPLYSGYMLQRFLPAKTEDVTDVVREPETMWLYFSLIAISSTIMLVLAKGWVGKDFKTKS